MTALDSSAPCGCGGTTGGAATRTGGGPCGQDDLPVTPFDALRVAFGMLLGEDDFRVLMGNPRGKQMLHAAWLHGPGVLWGYGVHLDADGDRLRAAPGLAVDGWGRELALEAEACASLTAWATRWAQDHPAPSGPPGPPGPSAPDPCTGQPAPDPCPGGTTRRVTAWLAAEFASCPARPVPALADPCDITRRHDDYSRVAETVRVVVLGDEPPRRRPYHRLRVLFGLEGVTGPDDAAGREAAEAAARVRAAAPGRRAEQLLAEFRRLAAGDAVQDAPEREEGDACPQLFPVTEDHAPVVLAKLAFDVVTAPGCVRVANVDVDQRARTALLPTGALQELLCGLAPALLGETLSEDAGGPRLAPGSLRWSRGDTCLSLCFDRPVDRRSLEQALTITSLCERPEHGAGWARSTVAGVRLTDGGTRAVVDLELPPAHRLVRVLIRGTGPEPCYGTDPWVPFAGLTDGPAAGRHDGHDAVLTMHLHQHDCPDEHEHENQHDNQHGNQDTADTADTGRAAS
ncbi:hypothetical protein [Streptomyces rubellomurinus]|uniref:Uncharacterized protein n=2 Tax=Streptomyces TaxID=1883 RepID=A0A0F2TAV9_STRR3|nr:hypothetical protein [Streptomyces rubellomurinus]KJS54791.1 hypothetical protein VM98_17080 [Streptomyces rubellomurinus subsp. indigoferus]KJS59591.1 hypothetical protein VM95_26360 [Streptomyces rubellomurinus]